MQKDLDAYGYTTTCQRCQHIRIHGPGTGTGPHSEECRAHIIGKLQETEEGRKRLAAADQRAHRAIVEHARRQEEAELAAAQGREADDTNECPWPAGGPR